MRRAPCAGRAPLAAGRGCSGGSRQPAIAIGAGRPCASADARLCCRRAVPHLRRVGHGTRGALRHKRRGWGQAAQARSGIRWLSGGVRRLCPAQHADAPCHARRATKTRPRGPATACVLAGASAPGAGGVRPGIRGTLDARALRCALPAHAHRERGRERQTQQMGRAPCVRFTGVSWGAPRRRAETHCPPRPDASDPAVRNQARGWRGHHRRV